MVTKKKINERSIERLSKKTKVNLGPYWDTECIICPYCCKPSEDAYKSPKDIGRIDCLKYTCLSCGKAFGVMMPRRTKTYQGAGDVCFAQTIEKLKRKHIKNYKRIEVEDL